MDRAGLQLLRRELIHMGEDSFHWVHVKTLGGATQGSDGDALAALVADRHYRDHYIGADSYETDSETVHGPYLLSRLSPDSFDLVSATEAERLVRTFAADWDMPTERDEPLERHVLRQIRRAGSVCRLRDLGEEAFCDCGWILDDFCEIVAVDRPAGSITVIVMAGD